jgi:ferric-dicitrate binding protein FerR (iron transport regulator)
MSDDLELGRVGPALDALADSVEPPGDDELSRMARTASSSPRAAARRLPSRPLPAALAALAASAMVLALALTSFGDDPGSRGGPAGDRSLVSFPEGSALRLLLTSTPQGDSR